MRYVRKAESRTSPTDQPWRAQPPWFPHGLSVLVGIVASMLVFAGAAQAQGEADPNSPAVPEIVGPASGEVIVDPSSTRLEWQAAKEAGADGAENSQNYRRLFQRLLVTPKADSQSAETAMRVNRPQIVKTYTYATRASPQAPPPEADSTSDTPYPVVGDWFPDSDDRQSSPNQDDVWTARLTYPGAGDWFPDEEDPRPRFPPGEYVWQVRLIGETENGDEQALASSQLATFVVRTGGEGATPEARSAPQAQNDPSAAPPGDVVLTLIPRGGLFLPGVSSVESVVSSALSSPLQRQSVFTYGGSIAFGSRDGAVNARLTGIQTTGSLISTTGGIESIEEPVPDKLLFLTSDLILRPIPRFLVQPYAIGGLGARQVSQRRDTPGAGNIWDLTSQVGLGIDLHLGNVTLGLEIVDYLTGFGSDEDFRHEAFVFTTVGVPIF